jgi:hypothetical protein
MEGTLMITFKLQVSTKDDPHTEDFTRDGLVTVTDTYEPVRPYDRVWEIVFDRLQKQMAEMWPGEGELQ